MRKLLKTLKGAIVAHRGPLWVLLALLVSVPISASVQARGEVRSGPRNPRLEVVAQEVDSILWRYQWVQPQVVGGGGDPDSYEIEWYMDDVPADGVDPFRVTTPGGSARETRLWTDYTCPDVLSVHVRARAHGNWAEGTVTPWSDVVTATVQQDCPLPPMPPPPEGTVDTVRTDTTALDLAMLDLRCVLQSPGYLASLGGPDLPAEPTIQTQADLRTMSGTGADWGSRSTLLLSGEPVAEVDMRHGGWTDSVRYVRIGSGFTLPEYDLEAGPDYAVRFEVDATGQVEEPDEGNNTLTAACAEAP